MISAMARPDESDLQSKVVMIFDKLALNLCRLGLISEQYAFMLYTGTRLYTLYREHSPCQDYAYLKARLSEPVTPTQ